MISLGDGFALPSEAVSETFAVLGKRGSGKTTTARVMAEGFLFERLPVVILDPTGVWWGLRSTADGKASGFPVVIFGGDHADVPLEETAGAVIAEVIVSQRLSAVIDMSLLSKSATRRFATDFLEKLYLKNRLPLHIIVDEADLLAPQRTFSGTERLLGAMEDMVRRGRVRGLGVTLITQRPASLNKDVLTQAEVLVCLRMTGPRDVQAIDEWVRLHAEEDQARDVKQSLPALRIGQAWVWSPGWLGTLQKINVNRPTTFDSSATPKPGEQQLTVEQLAPVDIEALGQQIAATIEKAKDNDPRQLKRIIARLQDDLAKKPDLTVDRVTTVERVEVPVIPPESLETIRAISEAWLSTSKSLAASAEMLLARVQAVESAKTHNAPVRFDRPERIEKHRLNVEAPVEDRRPSNGSLSKSERAILSALAQHGTRTPVQVALLTGYSHKSGGFRNSLSSLRTKGYIDGRGETTITDEGMTALGSFELLPTGAELREWWKAHHLGLAERKIIDVLAEAWPDAVSTEGIARLTGYSSTSGGFRNSLSRLRTLELASGRGELQINATLMEDY